MCNIINDFYGVTERKGIPVVSSRKVAEVFEKQHGHVIRDIEKVLADLLIGGLSNFGESNFIKSSYKNSQNKRQPEYIMTKDGFTLLVMGYSGEKATRFKVAYIERFNQMENFIKSLAEVKADFPEFTDAVMQLYEEPKHYHFSNEINMINRIVLGMDAKKFKEVNGLGDVPSIRPYLSPKQLEYIKILQRVDIGLCVAIKDFQQRKSILQDYFNRIVLKQIA
ncbi:phage regulatory protein, rha family [Caloramator quimbayensis]|uniref:Phage regulatory protein, rha family n=1 Tax=Caloramator quimbayensis TaxID=1147123 RepID=A0A1T4YHL1_9CLOT|nr:Rha family transcriptional regulator [Caloramator quimbayensis]SKB01317.1 phage regulatory protein, rha family [Caloramator quimbayensis]